MLRRGSGTKSGGKHQTLKLFYFRLNDVDVVAVVLVVLCIARELRTKQNGNAAVFLGARCEVGG